MSRLLELQERLRTTTEALGRLQGPWPPIPTRSALARTFGRCKSCIMPYGKTLSLPRTP